MPENSMDSQKTQKQMDHKTKIKTIKNQPRFFTQSRNDPVQVILWPIMQRFSSLEKCKTLRNVEGRRKKGIIRKEKENDYNKMDGMAMRTWLKNLKDQVGDRESWKKKSMPLLTDNINLIAHNQLIS